MKSILKIMTGIALIGMPTLSIVACGNNPIPHELTPDMLPLNPIKPIKPDMLPIKTHMLPINHGTPDLNNILINRNLGHVYCNESDQNVYNQQMLAFLKEREPAFLNGIKWNVIYISALSENTITLRSHDANIYIGSVSITFINDWK